MLTVGVRFLGVFCWMLFGGFFFARSVFGCFVFFFLEMFLDVLVRGTGTVLLLKLKLIGAFWLDLLKSPGEKKCALQPLARGLTLSEAEMVTPS